MSANNPRLSIILPAFNEGAHIFANIGKVRDAFLGKLSFEIIVVDDGSPDNTFAEASRAAQQWPEARAFRQKHNAGKGAKYTRSRLPVKLVWRERKSSERAARRLAGCDGRCRRCRRCAGFAR